jgi:hypothetical protein
MIETMLYRPRVGQCLNLKGHGPVVVVDVGAELGCFSGGVGVFHADVDLIPDEVLQQVGGSGEILLNSQLLACENILRES